MDDKRKKSKKVLDKEEDSDIIICSICGTKYFRNTDPYSKDIKCPKCFNENGELFFWKK